MMPNRRRTRAQNRASYIAARQLLRRDDLTVGDPDLGAPVDQRGRQRGAEPDAPPVTNAILPDTSMPWRMVIARPRRSPEILAAGSPRSVVKRTSAGR